MKFSFVAFGVGVYYELVTCIDLEGEEEIVINEAE